MSVDQVLLVLRFLSALLLLALAGCLFIMLWRDLRASVVQTQRNRRAYGTLIALIRAGEQLLPTGMQYPLLPFTTLGRAPTNTVVLSEPFASGEHVLLTLRNGQWWLEDRKSTNGTLLNNDPLTVPVIVTDGDILSIGSSYFKITLES